LAIGMEVLQYIDGVCNTNKENLSILSLIQMC